MNFFQRYLGKKIGASRHPAGARGKKIVPKNKTTKKLNEIGNIQDASDNLLAAFSNARGDCSHFHKPIPGKNHATKCIHCGHIWDPKNECE